MLYFFINPASRSGKGARKWDEVETHLKEKNIPYEAHFLEANVSPRPVMDEIFAKESGDVSIVLIGGDGTVNQCINGIPDFERLLLSVIPTGSGNDFCRNKAIPSTLEEQILNIVEKKNRIEVDRAVIAIPGEDGVETKRFFIVSTGIGYDAEICHEANQSKLKKALNKIKLGKLVYLMLGIKGIFSADLSNMTVTIDGKTTEYHNVFFIATMNQPFEGGGVAMTPSADDTDGQFDFLIVHGISRFKALCTVPLLYIKKHIGKPGVILRTGKEITASSSNKRTFHTDGECEEGCDAFRAYFDGKVHFIY